MSKKQSKKKVATKKKQSKKTKKKVATRKPAKAVKAKPIKKVEAPKDLKPLKAKNVANGKDMDAIEKKARDAKPVDSIVDELASKAEIRKRPAKRFTSGVSAIDDIFSSRGVAGFKCGIYLLVADPGNGKSSFALQIMRNMIEDGHLGAYLAYEGKDNIYDCIRRIGLPEVVPVVDQEDGWSPNSESIETLLRHVHKANKTKKPAVFCIDSVKNINPGEGGIKGRRIAIQRLVEVVQKTNSIVFLIAHVSKETRGKKVKRIQGPSELEELCDVRIDIVETAKGSGKRSMMLDISKNRHGRPGEFVGFTLGENGWTWPQEIKEYGGGDIETERDPEM